MPMASKSEIYLTWVNGVQYVFGGRCGSVNASERMLGFPFLFHLIHDIPYLSAG